MKQSEWYETFIRMSEEQLGRPPTNGQVNKMKRREVHKHFTPEQFIERIKAGMPK